MLCITYVVPYSLKKRKLFTIQYLVNIFSFWFFFRLRARPVHGTQFKSNIERARLKLYIPTYHERTLNDLIFSFCHKYFLLLEDKRNGLINEPFYFLLFIHIILCIHGDSQAHSTYHSIHIIPSFNIKRLRVFSRSMMIKKRTLLREIRSVVHIVQRWKNWKIKYIT